MYINTTPTNSNDIAVAGILAISAIATTVYLVNKDEINDYIKKRLAEKKSKEKKN